MRVLLVDDNLEFRDPLAHRLRAMGHTVATASRLREAFQLFRNFQPAVVLCDPALGGQGDGLALARRLRARPARMSLMLVAYTVLDPASVEPQARAAGYDLVVTRAMTGELLDGPFPRMAGQKGT